MDRLLARKGHHGVPELSISDSHQMIPSGCFFYTASVDPDRPPTLANVHVTEAPVARPVWYKDRIAEHKMADFASASIIDGEISAKNLCEEAPE
jgi:hypothetical protein